MIYFFEKLTNRQAVMHYSGHRPTALMAYMTTFLRASTNDQWAALGKS